MQSELTTNRYTLGEEIAHAVTHGIGIVLSIAGLALMVSFAALYGDVWHITSCSIYGATLILLYTASTLYHGITAPRVKRILQRIDHAAIFLLIAGTYTPFTLVNLRGGWGWTLFGLVWGIAVFGVVLEALRWRRLKWLSLTLYLGLGWLVVIALKPLIESVETGGLILLLIGGLCYSLGVIFYVWERLAYHHAVWHLFVMAGSVLHFFSVFFYVVPTADA
ncbi:MAG: hemolysin III family protein [Candidatus Thiodiazotropha sp. (ex Dulcina madagascariensis)]|nr:hemolysin III family protein [Candidatus Thiodiazotropha sp. (ex Dulcina madagascariensis)]MCU7928922.1 hemolysin III family protein [Candidatus Thiodiazotropha sp. (ex Dulcina madagascariensis)]